MSDPREEFLAASQLLREARDKRQATTIHQLRCLAEDLLGFRPSLILLRDLLREPITEQK